MKFDAFSIKDIPAEIWEAERKIHNYAVMNGWGEDWEFGSIASRDLMAKRKQWLEEMIRLNEITFCPHE
jgi:hypothetical protein